MTALLEYLDLTALLDHIDLLNRYSGGPFQAGARGKMPQSPPVGGPASEVIEAGLALAKAAAHVAVRPSVLVTVKC